MAVANPLEFQNVAIYSFKKKKEKKKPTPVRESKSPFTKAPIKQAFV